MKKRPQTSNSNQKNSSRQNNIKSKNRADSKGKTDLYLKDSKHAEKKIIEKYLQKGFESLTVEELAVTLISQTFESEFKRISGTQWPFENKSKAKERLNFSKFNIQWSVSMNNKSPAVMLKTPFGVLFTLVERGDVQKVTEFLRQNAQYLNEIINLVDNNKKSLLHVAAKVGNVNMLLFLLSKKFDVHARDKFLRTPLHLACQYGREVCADELLKAGSNILARDSIGRTCLHYAACSDSTNLVTLILGIDPDLIAARDTYGRTALHYSVWNGTAEQVNIVKKLLECKAEVDALDEEGMTSLHFAAEAGKGKIIPILLKYGANPFIRDGRTGRTAIELACNDRIREMIIVYCSKDYDPQLSLLKLYGTSFKPGEGIENGGEEINGGRRSRSRKKNLKSTNKNGEENDEMDVKISNLLQNTYRKKLLELLRAIQLYGVKTMQHLTKPELYSGSWLERINNANDFYNYINDLPPSEAVLSIYNVLYPYSDKLPKPQGEEPDLAFFFELNSNRRDGFSNGRRNTRGINMNENNANSNNNNNFNNDNFINNSEIQFLKEQIKRLNQKIDESRNEIETTEMTKLKLQIEKYQTENDILKQQSNNLNNQINSLSENVKNYEKKQQKLQKMADVKKDNLIKDLKNQLDDLNLETNNLRNDNMNLAQGVGLKKNGLYINPKLIDTESPIYNLTLDEEKSVYIFVNYCNKTKRGLYNILLDYDKDNDFYLLKQEFISVLDYVQLPFEHRDTVIKVSGFDISLKLSIHHIVSAFFEREENKVIKLNHCLFNIILKFCKTKKTVQDLYDAMKEKTNNSNIINKDDLNEILIVFLIREEDRNGLINNWDYKNKEGIFDIEDLKNHLKQRENIIYDVVDINREFKFGGELNTDIENDKNNMNDESDNKSKSEHSNNNIKNTNKESNNSNGQNDNDEYLNNNNFNITHKNFSSNLNISDPKIQNKISKTILEESFEKEKEKDNYIESKDNNNNINEEINNNNEKEEEKEENNYNDFDNKVEEEINNNISKDVEESKNEEIESNNILDNENEDNNNEENNNEEEISPKKKKKKSTSKKKKKGKKSKEKLNINEVINGELKVQVTNIENVMISKNIYLPCPFYLACSMEGIDKILKSREVVTEDLRNVVFNWATRILLKKKTLKDLSCKCNINVSVDQNNKNISLGNCEFEWRKCLLKSNWDKFAINETFQVLTDRKYKKIPMGNIKILAKFIPFGSKNSNYDKFGKKKKTPTNLNGIAEEPSHNSSVSIKENKSIMNDSLNNENNINNNEELNNNNEEENNIDIVDNIEENIDEDYNIENKGKQILKNFDLEITSADNKGALINKGYNLCISALDDGEETNKSNLILKEILPRLPFTTDFAVYSHKNYKNLKIIIYLKDEEDNEIGKLPIILSNKESHLEKTGKYIIRANDDIGKYSFFLKITVNTDEDL